MTAHTDPSARWTDVFEGLDREAFTELAVIAAELSHAPMAMVTLVDEDRHWFTSVTGVQLTAGPWEQTFCSHAVRQTNLFVVPDATLDPQFAFSPLVQSSPFVRFYAGAPLLAGNQVLGTLCVMDRTPRQLTSSHQASLRALARQVVMQLQLRRQTLELARLNQALAEEANERRVTEDRLRQSEKALRTSQAALEQLDAARRELVADVSHDLRTPLTALQGYLDTVILKGGALSDEVRQQYLDQASAQSRRLGRLVADLFELAQLDGGQDVFPREPFEIAELTRDVVQTFVLGARAKGVDLRFHCDAGSTVVSGSVRLMERVVGNLLDNAIRFTPDGGQVTATCYREASRVGVRISDTGPGIAPADRARIFDRFYRGQQAAGVGPTAGLGLSIAKRIVELHGGELVAAANTGGGTEFSLLLAATEWDAITT
ncbi:MAG TPA: GAF domain-containing sensor histidine kinase [Vicinamibacterales bacterium]|nr:GAF domain-containing sensor histidine kinase [Vicinamibacterales bacterium]